MDCEVLYCRHVVHLSGHHSPSILLLCLLGVHVGECVDHLHDRGCHEHVLLYLGHVQRSLADLNFSIRTASRLLHVENGPRFHRSG